MEDMEAGPRENSTHQQTHKMSNNNNHNAAARAHLTVLDRRIIPLLENPDETASRQTSNNNNNNQQQPQQRQPQQQQHDTTNGTMQGDRSVISPRIERIHRLHGTSLLHDAALLLEMGASTYATACTLFHRFFAQVSLMDQNVWSVAMACLLLATKLEEEQGKVPYTLSQMALVFCHLYRKRLLWILPTATTITTTTTTTTISENHSHRNDDDNHNDSDNKHTTNGEPQNSASWLSQLLLKQCRNSSSSASSFTFYEGVSVSGVTVAALSPFAETWTTLQKETRLAQLPLPNKLGPVHQEWIHQLSKMEQVVLRQLGFTMYWIPDSHPHKYILYFCRVLELDQAQVQNQTKKAFSFKF
jgi:hypothetical protein